MRQTLYSFVHPDWLMLACGLLCGFRYRPPLHTGHTSTVKSPARICSLRDRTLSVVPLFLSGVPGPYSGNVLGTSVSPLLVRSRVRRVAPFVIAEQCHGICLSSVILSHTYLFIYTLYICAYICHTHIYLDIYIIDIYRYLYMCDRGMHL